MILDSNIMIYAAKSTASDLRRYLKKNETVLKISAITKVEVLGYHLITQTEKNLLEAFLSSISILPIEENVIDKAINLKQERKMTLGDALIAATSLIYDLPLLTHNEADYKHIADLKLIPLKNIL